MDGIDDPMAMIEHILVVDGGKAGQNTIINALMSLFTNKHATHADEHSVAQ